jgi:hypothetical protein
VRQVVVDDLEQMAAIARPGFGAVDDDRVVIEVFAVHFDPNLFACVEL